MQYLYTLSIITKKGLDALASDILTSGILNRLIIILARNRLLLDKIHYEEEIFQVTICTSEKIMDRVIGQIERIIDLLEVKIIKKVEL